MVGVQVALTRANHDRQVTDVDAIFDIRDWLVVTDYLEIKVDWGIVSQLTKTALQRSCWMLGSIGLTNGWAAKMNILHSDDNLMV